MDAAQPPAMAVQKPPRSPPMAFEKTSNDALWAPFNPLTLHALSQASSPYDIGGLSSENDVDAQLNKLNEALRLQHLAFVAERESWQMERDRLHRRITALESLLKTPKGQSPERSPAISPQDALNLSSTTSQLPTIVEVDTIQRSPESLRIKRDCAPVHIDLPTLDDSNRADATAPPTDVLRDDFPASPPATRNTLSPPPPANRHLAGHTPLKAPRPGNFSPAMSIMSDKLNDTPTRTNTFTNETMTDGIDEDHSLKGPLHMPSLPCMPGEENFTMDMLDARLKDIMEHPEENQPVVLQTSSQPDEASEVSPVSTDSQAPKVDSVTGSKDKLQVDNGGIRLRTKMTSNFGAPLGQLGSWKR